MAPAPEFHTRLVEEAVRAALRGRSEEGAFHREREAVYLRPEGHRREAAFAGLHAAWFERLGLAAPLTEALAARLGPGCGVGRVVVVPVAGSLREAAELYVTGEAPEGTSRRSVVIAMRPETLIDPAAARRFLHRELLHVADMLDPEFSYEPRLPQCASGPAHDRIVLERYRILWDASVDGRLMRTGLLPESVRQARLEEFGGAFAMLGERSEDCFASLFDGPRPEHPRLVALALDPAAAFGLAGWADGPPDRCPLCGFPRAGAVWPELRAGGALAASIRADFPLWIPEAGACRQCADLYAARVAAAVARV